MARPTLLQPYVRNSLPLMPDGDVRFLQDELQRVEAAFADITSMVPQVATVAPKLPRDGMIRLARSPWRPVGGTVDIYVYWNAPTSAWVVL